MQLGIKDSMDAESNSEFRMLPLHLITFKIDANVDITSPVLCNMVVVDHSVKQLAALPMFIRSPASRSRFQPNQTGIGRLWRQEQHYYTIINRFLFSNIVNNMILTC